jgi:hypothetical protein
VSGKTLRVDFFGLPNSKKSALFDCQAVGGKLTDLFSAGQSFDLLTISGSKKTAGDDQFFGDDIPSINKHPT